MIAHITKTATFIIFEAPEERIGSTLTLNGIGEGYNKLPWACSSLLAQRRFHTSCADAWIASLRSQ